MAKCKYLTLATQITIILAGIDQSVKQSRKRLQMIQFHFYEEIVPISKSLASEAYFIQQLKAHVIGMSFLSPSQELQIACHSHPYLGALLFIRLRLHSKCGTTWWKVKTSLPKDMESIIAKRYWETLLYCPESSEISNEIDWFEKENHANSYSFQVQSIFAMMERESSGKSVIGENLNQLALPYFGSVIKKWKIDPDGHDTIPKDPSIVFTKSFAPTKDDNLSNAYDKVRRALNDRALRNYEHLMRLWRHCLEDIMFTNVDWTDDEKEVFIKKWETNIFGYPVKRPKIHEGRWEQTMAIPREDAGQIVKYFLDRFLANPSKKKRDGETACLLWTLIWLSQDAEATSITLTRVLNFDTTNIDKENPAITFDGKSIEISMGLYQLLKVLKGRGKGKRLRRLFANLSKDYLQHAVREASLALFGPHTIPVLPAAFLTFPHPMKGARFSKQQRERLRVVDPVPAASHTRRQILKTLREGQAKKPLSPP